MSILTSPALRWVKPSTLLTCPAGAVLWLPGQDDAYSTTIRDRSGNNNHGTITGATWSRLPSGLWVLSFDGDDYIAPPRITGLWANGGTVLFFCKPTDGQPAAYQFLWGGRTDNTRCYAYLDTDGTVYFAVHKDAATNYVTSRTAAAVFANGTVDAALLGFVLPANFTSVKIYKNGASLAVTESNAGTVTAASLAVADVETPHFGAAIIDGVPHANKLVGQLSLETIIQTPLTAAQMAGIWQQWRHLQGV